MSLFGYAALADILREDFKDEITLGSGPVPGPVSSVFLEWMEMWVHRQGTRQSAEVDEDPRGEVKSLGTRESFPPEKHDPECSWL